MRERPQSAWTPSLRLNLGKHYISRMQRTPALAHLAAAWQATKVAQVGATKELGDAAIGHLTRALVVLGRTEDLDVIWDENRNRRFVDSPYAQMWIRTFEKHFRMQKYVEDSYTT